MNIQDWFPLGWTIGSPFCPRDCQESSPTAWFKSINSSVLRFLYSPTLTSVHDYWKKIVLKPGILVVFCYLRKKWTSILLFSHSVVSNSFLPHGTAAYQTSLSFTISQSLLKLRSIESVMPSNHLILCHSLWRGCLQWRYKRLPPIPPSIRVFSSESTLRMRWPKYWSFHLHY